MTIDITEAVDTLKHVQGLKQSIPQEWTQQNKRLSPRETEALKLIERAENEGRDICVKDIAEEMGVCGARAQQMVQKLRRQRRVTVKPRTRQGIPLTTMVSAEDLEYPYNCVTPQERLNHRAWLARQRKEEQYRISEQEKREAEAKFWVWNPHGWIYLPDWKARYDFPNGGPA